ncbi:striatin-3 isoform X1 [Corythoichthys intestinalis]|uniref:striatin-3 isoform X1 n=1 Tax=Corythoichthys intestinalis TaxID=161448 RepID=UPI0025A555A9|nr:striatin-3 isoform X1 [Corythoichthys intestinalis]
MDEHPGGGVAGPPPPQQQLQPGGTGGVHPAIGGGPGGGGTLLGPQSQPQQSDELPRPQQQYTIPGILHYIQHEWARFEMERAHWEVERAELQARIAFLQGERKGQENLKNDLVRRIKMLEYALKQERAKYHKLKYGTELNQGDLKLPSFESDAKDSEVSALPANSQLTWKQGRQLLRQYLQEVGYTDTILDVRTQRVRSLLGLSTSDQNGSVDKKNLQQLINGDDARKDAKRGPGDVLETFNFLENAEDSDEEEDEDGELMDDIGDDIKHHRKHKNKVGNEGLASEEDDADTEEALKEFDFLVTAEDGEGAGEARSSGDGTEWAEPLPFAPGGGKNFLMGGADRVLESVLGLGDLADLTVTNDDVDFSYDLASNQESSFRKTWNPKYTLRSHFDGVRALAFHPMEPCLLTVSEDHTLKLWNLTKTVAAKKSTSLDVEPIYTFRAHVGPVLSLAMTSNGEQCFSGGIDATVQWWNVPGSNVDPYDTYDASALAGTWTGHTDAVWALAYSGIKNRLLSCSADGTVKLWNPQEENPCISTFNAGTEHGVPTSVDFNGCEPAHAVASFDGGDVVVYDLETSQSTLVMKGQSEGSKCLVCVEVLHLFYDDGSILSPGRPGCHHIYKVVSHPTLPVTITAHEDRNIKFFDNKSGKVIHAMVAHLDAVTSLAVDPNGIYLMSGSHDCSLRLWNLDSKTCVQEITAHRKKSDEAIYDVTFHPSKAYIASAGADALARVYV